MSEKRKAVLSCAELTKLVRELQDKENNITPCNCSSNKPVIKFKGEVPFRAYEEAAGFDLVAAHSAVVPVGHSRKIKE